MSVTLCCVCVCVRSFKDGILAAIAPVSHLCHLNVILKMVSLKCLHSSRRSNKYQISAAYWLLSAGFFFFCLFNLTVDIQSVTDERGLDVLRRDEIPLSHGQEEPEGVWAALLGFIKQRARERRRGEGDDGWRQREERQRWMIFVLNGVNHHSPDKRFVTCIQIFLPNRRWKKNVFAFFWSAIPADVGLHARYE